MDAEQVRALVLHGSWRGRVTAALSPTLVTGFGAIGLAGVGVRLWPMVIVMLGLGLGAVVAYDYPLRTVFGEEHVERRCLLRTERLEWEQISTIARPAYALGRRRRRASTGLVAVVGKRRYLLTDRMESRPEHHALLRLIGVWARGTEVDASLPPDDWPPTWLYKRRLGDSDTLVDQL